MQFSLSGMSRVLVTLVAVGAAVAAGAGLWQRYEVQPWTRDGRIKANVIQVAPDVTGQVTRMLVHDNQQVAREIGRAHV